ncbi:MAG: 16S rRNA (uracil(1498)-N(3))-methyltransferase [Bacteroidetes bacterium]|nr:16S rRNA (uracil(1498)-N(3))-methyltransferase [Bacteroidota bacterium]
MHLFYSPVVSEGIHLLAEEESRHCTRVLRLMEGDTIYLTNGLGDLHKCIIRDANPKKCLLEVESVQHEYRKRLTWLHIAIAPTKNIDRFEWFLEKATEIGIDEITPLFCAHSERNRINRERMQKILVAAMKQSLKAYLPKLNEPVEYLKFIQREFPGQKFTGYCETGREEELHKLYRKGTDVTILIGPEGDFSPEEIEQGKNRGLIPISLGKSRLRTETAGIVACNSINLLNEL